MFCGAKNKKVKARIMRASPNPGFGLGSSGRSSEGLVSAYHGGLRKSWMLSRGFVGPSNLYNSFLSLKVGTRRLRRGGRCFVSAVYPAFSKRGWCSREQASADGDYPQRDLGRARRDD